MGKSSPKAPDPVATAQAQGAANEQAARTTAKLNNPDTYGPGGTVTHGYGVDGDKDHVEVHTNLSPAQQQIYDNQTNMGITTSGAANDAAGHMAGLLKEDLNTKGLMGWGMGADGVKLPAMTSTLSGAGQGLVGGVPLAGQGIQTGLAGAGQGVRTDVAGAGQGIRSSIGGAGEGIQSGVTGAGQGVNQTFDQGSSMGRIGVDNFSTDRQAVSDALLARTEPQQERDRTALEARLAAQGFTSGSQGYHDAADELNRQKNDARMQAVLAGGQEQSRLFGLDVTRTGFNNAASQTETAARNTALQMGNAAQGQSFGQGVTAAQFANAAQEQGFGQRAQDAGFTNTAQAQGFGQGVTADSFANAGQAQAFGQTAQAGQFANTAQAQEVDQLQRNAALTNAAQGQGFDQAASAAGFGNQARAQAVNETYAQSDNQTKLRQQQLAERLMLRAQPVNEVSALFGLGNGVQMPQQAQVSPTQVAAPDYQGLVSNKYKTDSANAASANSSTAAAGVALASAAVIAI